MQKEIQFPTVLHYQIIKNETVAQSYHNSRGREVRVRNWRIRTIQKQWTRPDKGEQLMSSNRKGISLSHNQLGNKSIINNEKNKQKNWWMEPIIQNLP